MHRFCKRLGGTGAYFWMKSGDETRTVAETPSSSAFRTGGKNRDHSPVTAGDEREVRAGQNLTYILSVENTGELPLENIEISSVFLRII